MEGFGKRTIRVLAADDSAVMRGILRQVLLGEGPWRPAGTPAMELCEVSHDGVECVEAVARLRPDVLLLDLEMPRMHGLDVLDRLQAIEPGLPVIMCSAYTERGARTTLDALARGAADYVMKPSGHGDAHAAMASLASQLLPRIVALAAGRERRGREFAGALAMCPPGLRRGVKTSQSAVADVATTRAQETANAPPVDVVVIGVSTGGPSALEQMLPKLPRDFAVPVLIVQHMPKLFTGALAARLNRCCNLEVREAHAGAEIHAGTIWLAPGDAHMEVTRVGSAFSRERPRIEPAEYVLRLHQEEPLHHCKPAVDYLFRSAAKAFGENVLALVMTGMGSDGVEGARAVHRAGGTVLAQDEASSAVWGMPGRIMQAGIAGAIVPLDGIARELIERVKAGRSQRIREIVPQAAGTVAPMLGRLTGVKEVGHGLL